MAVHSYTSGEHEYTMTAGTTSGGSGYTGPLTTSTSWPITSSSTASITLPPIPATIPTTKPSSPTEGSLWLDTATDSVYMYVGKKWRKIATAEPPEPEPLDPDRPMDVNLD